MIDKDSKILFRDMIIVFAITITSSFGLYGLGKISLFYPIVVCIVSFLTCSYIVIDELKFNRIKPDLINDG